MCSSFKFFLLDLTDSIKLYTFYVRCYFNSCDYRTYFFRNGSLVLFYEFCSVLYSLFPSFFFCSELDKIKRIPKYHLKCHHAILEKFFPCGYFFSFCSFPCWVISKLKFLDFASCCSRSNFKFLFLSVV